MEEIEIVKKLTHKFIFERKKTLGCSNYKLAQLTGMSRQTIDSFEKNYMHNLTLDSYLRLCGALNLRPNLIEYDEINANRINQTQ